MKRSSPQAFLAALFLCLCLLPAASRAQTFAAARLPDSPGELLALSSVQSSSLQSGSSSTPQPSTADSDGQQSKRILGIIPNFRAVSANTKLPPQTVKDKFITASQDSFDYSSLALPAVLSGYSLGVNSVPEFGTGAPAFGRYYWHAFVDQTIENYSVEFIVPAIAHEDTRYYTLGHGGFLKRTKYSLSRVVITRTDNARPTFNAGEVLGAAMGASISNAYYPQSQRTFSNTAQRWALNIGIDAGTFVFKEFWPDINHTIFHQER